MKKKRKKSSRLIEENYFDQLGGKVRNNRLKKIKRFIFFLVLIGVIGIFFTSDFSKVNKILIKGNKIYSEKDIRDVLNFNEESIKLLVIPSKVESLIEEKLQVKDVKVTKSFKNGIKITIDENLIVGYYMRNNQPVFLNEKGQEVKIKKELQADFKASAPLLVGFNNKDVLTDLSENLSNLGYATYSQISQIKSTPKSYDREYVQLIMAGDRQIYINVSIGNMAETLKSYNEIAATMDETCIVIEAFQTQRAIVNKCQQKQ